MFHTWQLLSYKISKAINTYLTYSTAYKSVGLNLGGLPTDNGRVMTELAIVRPEYVQHWELGIKTTPFAGTTLNLTAYNTNIEDYQTLVQTAETGVNRGYLSNAEEVRIRGIEFDGASRISKNFSAFGALAFTEGTYVSFKNAPVPLEETGAPSAFKDISGGDLPGISKWAASLGGEYSTPAAFLGKAGNFFIAADGYYRSGFSSSPSPSKYLNVPSYMIANARVGFPRKQWAYSFCLGQKYFGQRLL
jgi:iron complex outermembrane receptor protein